MYTSCLFCNRDLGTNELVESFQVGRRLAFDQDKGRLWVVCRKCERWNLTPLEERWEAIEECERLFRSTRLRTSTENVGMARLSEGLELVRIGRPLRPEFAAWRYGDQFGRRRRKTIIWTVAGTAVIGGALAGLAVAGVGVAGFMQLPQLLLNARQVARLKTEDGRLLRLRPRELGGVRLTAGGSIEDWTLEVKHNWRVTRFRGDAARKAAAKLMPVINASGASRAGVRDAVRLIEAAGDPETYLFHTTICWLQQLPRRKRLALEMALHEEQERRALEGELAVLEEAWREAEEVAGIADDLLVPASSRQFLDRHRS